MIRKYCFCQLIGCLKSKFWPSARGQIFFFQIFIAVPLLIRPVAHQEPWNEVGFQNSAECLFEFEPSVLLIRVKGLNPTSHSPQIWFKLSLLSKFQSTNKNFGFQRSVQLVYMGCYGHLLSLKAVVYFLEAQF